MNNEFPNICFMKAWLKFRYDVTRIILLLNNPNPEKGVNITMGKCSDMSVGPDSGLMFQGLFKP